MHHFIGDFGGDHSNITLFGESTGASDIVSHLLSSCNEKRPLFHRAIVQSAILDPNIPDVPSAGWHMSRLMSALHITTIDQLRALDADKLVPFGQALRGVDDGIFFRKDWKHYFVPEGAHAHHHHQLHDLARLSRRSESKSRSRRSTSRPMLDSAGSSLGSLRLELPANLQPLIVGDCASDALLWALPASHWTPSGVARRLKAICQSLSKASNLLNAYDISSHTPDDEITERVLDLINDARVAWPTECVAQSAKRDRGGRGVWRYVFDQEGPTRGIPHHAADILYLFDNAPLPESARPSSRSMSDASDVDMMYPESFSCDFDDDDGMEVKIGSVFRDEEFAVDDEAWATPSVDEWSYARVRDAIQERWISFASGEAPWNEEKVMVFGPEGETGERSSWIFEGRRRRHTWKEALEPLGMSIVHKVGVELSRGPPLSGR